MTPELFSLLRTIDTPTVCNAIEVVQGRRGFDAFTRGNIIASAPDAGAIIGRALTAKISALRPSEEPPEMVRTRRLEYYEHMASGDGPRIAIVEDVDGKDAVGAFWGELNTNVHKGFGLVGALTNGVMRDLGDLAENFPVFAGAIGPSHAFVHVTEVEVPVTVFGLQITPGDWVHADRHGALVIPTEALADLAAAVSKMQQTEQIVLKAAQSSDFNFSKFKTAWAAFENART